MNMTKSAFLFVLLLFSVRAFGQTDTIFSNNEKIPCIVKEIKESSVVYVHPGEELLNSIYKNAVQKIVFKNGNFIHLLSVVRYRLTFIITNAVLFFLQLFSIFS